MTYPPRPTRRTNFRQAESAGLPVNTGDLDAEFNQLVSVLDQVVTRLTAISTSDGRLQGSAALTALALAGAQRFVATAGQTVFLTTIVWDSTMTSLGTPVMVNGVMRDPSAVTVANSGGFLQATLTAGAVLSDIVVVMAYTAGAGIAARLADGSSPSNAANMVTVQDADSLFYATTVEGALRELRLVLNQFFSAFNTPSGTQRFTATAGQTVFTTTIAWDGSLSTRNVFVYQSGVLLLASAYSVSNATGFLRVTLGTGATLGELVEVDVYSLAAMWTGNGTDLAGRAAQSDFNLGTHKITNLAPGVLPTDAVNVQQLQALVSISDLLSIFIRKDGSVAFTANQSLGGHKLTSVADGTTATDGATFGQMQTADALALALNGTETSVPRGTLTGPVSYGQSASNVADADQTTTPASVVHPTIHGVPMPGADDQVANRAYVRSVMATQVMKCDYIFYDSPSAGNWVASGSGAGTWTAPAGVTVVLVEAIGGGGGGGGGGEDSVGAAGVAGGDTTFSDGTVRVLGKGGSGGGGAGFGGNGAGGAAGIAAPDATATKLNLDGTSGAIPPGGDVELDFGFFAGGAGAVGDTAGSGGTSFGTGGGGGGSDGTGGVGTAGGRGGGGGAASWGTRSFPVVPAAGYAVQIGKGGDGGACGTGTGGGAGGAHRAGTDGTVPVGNDGGGGGGGGAGMMRIWYTP